MKSKFFEYALRSFFVSFILASGSAFADGGDGSENTARIPPGMQGVWEGTSRYLVLDTENVSGPQSEYFFDEKFVITDKVIYSVREEGTTNERFDLDLLSFHNNQPLNSFSLAKNHNDIHFGKGSGFCNLDSYCTLNIHATDAALEHGAADYNLNMILQNPNFLLLEGIRVCKNQLLCERWNLRLKKKSELTEDYKIKIEKIVKNMDDKKSK